MSYEVDSNGVLKEAVVVPALVYVNHETGQDVALQIIDKHPELGDFHYEGRRVVEVSVELMNYIMTELGWTLQVPGQNETREEN